MRIIRKSEHRLVPWRNGQGTTREIIQNPDAPADGRFDWRLSIATVDRSGPFSVFPGIDRTIAVLSGDGFMLRVADQEAHLSTQSSPYAFAGELVAAALVAGGPSSDLNIMTRRAAFRHGMTRLPAGASTIARNAAITILLTTGPLRLSVDGRDHHLDPLDTALFDGPGTDLGVTMPAGTSAFCIAINPA